MLLAAPAAAHAQGLDPRAVASKAFLSGEALSEKLPASARAGLPPDFLATLGDAEQVQNGPGGLDAAAYSAKVLSAADRLGIKDEASRKAAVLLYSSRRPGANKGGARGPDADEKAALEQARTANARASRVGRGSLGTTPESDGITAGGLGVPGTAPGQSASAAARIAALQGQKEVQMPGSFNLRPAIVPAPRGAPASPAPVKKESPGDGLVANAIAHWDQVGEDPNTSAAGRMGAATMVAFLKAFNLDGYENSTNRLSETAADPYATKGQVLAAAGGVGGNAALTAAGLLPAGAWIKLASATKAGAIVDWAGNAAKMFKANPAIAERVAALQQKALTSPLSREEAAWLGEHANDGTVIFHGTNEVDKIVASGRVAATTERFVYGARQEVSTVFRQLKAGVLPKDQLVVFQGQAAKLFNSHEATGLYSGMKKLAGQMTTNGTGDIVITRFTYNAETKTLSVLEARMVTEGEESFLLQKPGWSLARLWGRRLLLDPLATSAAGLVAVDARAQSKGQDLFEYVLSPDALPPQTAGP
jgi:hypothetical protein